MNFDIISQVQEKLGRQVFKLSVLKDLTPDAYEDKDYWRSKWIYFNIKKDSVKYGKDKSFPCKDLRRCWHTDNQNFYYIVEDKYGRARSLRFGEAVQMGILPQEYDGMLEARDIKSYNSGTGVGVGLQLVFGVIIGLVIGLFAMYAFYPVISGALHG